jgi:hypothetical protein
MWSIFGQFFSTSGLCLNSRFVKSGELWTFPDFFEAAWLLFLGFKTIIFCKYL